MKLNENARFKSKIEGSELSGKGDSAGRTAKAGDNIDYSEAFSSKYTEATLKKRYVDKTQWNFLCRIQSP